MRRIILAGLGACIGRGHARRPGRSRGGRNPPRRPDSSDTFPAGLVCDFEVRLDGWSNEKVKVTVDEHGREKIVVTGPARTLVTNADTWSFAHRQTGGRVGVSSRSPSLGRAA